MAQFAPYRPERQGTPDLAVVVRAAVPDDVAGIGRVMATRGGTAANQRDRAAALLGSAAVVLVAVDAGSQGPLSADDGGVVVGWCGVRRRQLDELPGEMPDRWTWCVVGLTVDPVRHRRGIGSRLLAGVLAEVHGLEPDAVVRSVVNAGNLASLCLHARCGFREEARGPTFAGITFDGGVGVLLRTS